MTFSSISSYSVAVLVLFSYDQKSILLLDLWLCHVPGRRQIHINAELLE